MAAPNTPDSTSMPHEMTKGGSGGGFWAWLLGEEGPQPYSASPQNEEWFNRRATSGGSVLSVDVDDDSRIHLATEILERHHPIEMEESTEEASTTGRGAEDTRTEFRATPAAQPVGTLGKPHATGGEEVIPLAKEELQIGKRLVDRGTTRIRRYVVETPVERDVTLHGERVTIERRRPVETSAAGHTFEERTVEVHETEEVPEVEKTARVTEEVTIRKEATERTETVRDTVRREEVDVTGNDGKPTVRS
jgi:uncharacterized protein (TIGR02271 family)